MCSTPPSIGNYSIPSGTVIYVPLGASDAYKKRPYWRNYTIMESSGTNVAMGNNKGGGSFGGSGSGTKDDPYLIFNPIQLHNIRNFTGYDDVYFKLMSDIDLTEFIDDNSPTEAGSLSAQSNPLLWATWMVMVTPFPASELIEKPIVWDFSAVLKMPTSPISCLKAPQ